MHSMIFRRIQGIASALVSGFATMTAGAQALPPDIAVTRIINELVYLDFKPLPENRTEVTLRNFGYGTGEDWAKARAYFENAWPAVMGSLEKRFAAKG